MTDVIVEDLENAGKDDLLLVDLVSTRAKRFALKTVTKEGRETIKRVGGFLLCGCCVDKAITEMREAGLKVSRQVMFPAVLQ